MEVDREAWSGDGEFTRLLVDTLETFDQIAHLRVEDAPASRDGGGYVLIATEIFVAFTPDPPPRPRARWPVLLGRRPASSPGPTLCTLESRLAAVEGIGPADYSDEGMLQYLRTQRIVPPYQTRGYKLVEMVRIYGVPGSAR